VAGLHYDYRIVVGDKAYSWATKLELPPLGGTQLLFEQPVHTASYALSKKVIIPKGQYGAGVTTLDWVKRGKIRNPEEKEDQFSIVLRNKNRLFFKKLPEKYGANAWLFRHLPPKPETPIKVEPAGNKYLEKIASRATGVCDTPGAIYHSKFSGSDVGMTVTLPRGISVPVMEMDEVEWEMHDALECILAKYFKKHNK
jgi:hypothetical protein